MSWLRTSDFFWGRIFFVKLAKLGCFFNSLSRQISTKKIEMPNATLSSEWCSIIQKEATKILFQAFDGQI
jgi:hypothetical protein